MLKVTFEDDQAEHTRLIVNGVIDKSSYASKWEDGRAYASVHSQRVVNKLMAAQMRELELHFAFLYIETDIVNIDHLSEISIEFPEKLMPKY
jgi:hypothetical protein